MSGHVTPPPHIHHCNGRHHVTCGEEKKQRGSRIGYISVIKMHFGANLPAGRFGGRTVHAPAILQDGGAQGEDGRTDTGTPGYISVIKIHSGTNLPAGRFGGRTAHAPAILEEGGAQERRRTDLGRPALCPICVQSCPICVQHSAQSVCNPAPSVSSTLPRLFPILPHLCPALCPISVQHSAPSLSSTLPHLCPALCPISVQHSAPSLSSTLPHLCPALCPISSEGIFRFFKVATFCFDDCFAQSWHSLDELQEDNDLKHTSRLCKGYLTKKESDGVLRQITWPPYSPDLNPIEMVLDELDRRVKAKKANKC
ncbi:unnamed protein product [Ranitomeya imitator]|uniref:Tc1-like transposase DDE domain-containing protein n=1 Tax=Ranitomeya imitator TaxID=111125 RepID=A0ABN9LVU9_9NEOB|nr:unnamed protein product [Ranitomeya imitator]